MILYVNDCSSFKDFTNVILEKLSGPDDKCGKANIIIADLKLYENYYLDQPELSTSVNYINKVGNVNVTLVESLSELITVLGEHFLAKEKSEQPDLPPIGTDTKIIGLFGIFDHFITEGNKLMTRKWQENDENDYQTEEGLNGAFMDLKDYSAKTVNFICNLMYNLKFYRKYQIYLNEPYEGAEKNNNEGMYSPIIWNRQLPNLQPVGKVNPQREVIHSNENPIEEQNARSIVLDETEMGTLLPDNCANSKPSELDDRSKQLELVPLGLILSKWARII
mmetsp:Transcript_2768/g.2699  ORF Transcript_2768/g.2699 Transcript_2768/m.2699 type:complete len:278 (-) Transcript_2768:831-1664(-)